MATRDRQAVADADGPSIGFKAAIAFYIGVLVAGVVASVSVLAGAENATVLSTVPTVVTFVTIVGVVLADRAIGLPVRLGRSRRRRLVWFLPPLALAAILLAHGVGVVALEPRLTLTTGFLFVVTIPLAIGGARMARNRAIVAHTPDESAASWDWQRSGLLSSQVVTTGLVALALLTALATLLAGNWLLGLFWIGYCVFLLYSIWSDHDAIGDPTDRWNPPTLHAHESGLRIEKSLSSKFVPWDRIEAVQLTEDELVLERRRWLDVHCDRTAIDDPEAVFGAIERVRATDEPSTATISTR